MISEVYSLCGFLLSALIKDISIMFWKCFFDSYKLGTKLLSEFFKILILFGFILIPLLFELFFIGYNILQMNGAIKYYQIAFLIIIIYFGKVWYDGNRRYEMISNKI